METRNVFIDTSIFIGQNYNYQNDVFDSLRRQVVSNQIKVYVTDITVREVEAHIEADVSKAIQEFSNLKKKARIFRNINESPFKSFFQEIDEAKVCKELKGQFAEFLDQIDAQILSTNKVSIEAVFDKYFGKHPPFGTGKKKAEFPDAFVIETLESWCKENGEKIYVISSDTDVEKSCENINYLIYLDSIAKFINIIESHDEALASKVRELIKANIEKIKESIAESFCEEGFWIEDQDGDVNEVSVNELDIEDILLLDISKDSAVVQLSVITSFSADITYDDLDTATYDSEDKILIPWQTISKTVDQDVEYTAIVHVGYNLEDKESLVIRKVIINTENGFGFSVSSNDEWPYK